MGILSAVVQSNLQRSLPFGELEEDLSTVDTNRGVEVTPDLKNDMRYEITPTGRIELTSTSPTPNNLSLPKV